MTYEKMKFFKLKIIGVVFLGILSLELINFSLVPPEISSVRRIKDVEETDILGGAWLIIYTPDGEELRFNKKGWEIDPPEGRKRRLSEVLDTYLEEYNTLLIKTRLNSGGELNIAGRRACFGHGSGDKNPYANKLVEVKLEKSLEEGGAITDLWFLNEKGGREKYATDKEGNVIINETTGKEVSGHQEFNLIYEFSDKSGDNKGELIRSYYSKINSETIQNFLNKYGPLLIKTRLNSSGQLKFAGKSRATFGYGSGDENPYANKLVEIKLVKSKEKAGSIMDVWILDEEGNRVEKKFIWVEDFNGNIITSFYRFPLNKLDLRNVSIYIPEHKRGIINLPDRALRVYDVNDDELIRIDKGPDGKAKEISVKRGSRWEKVEYQEIKDKKISYTINGDNELVLKGKEFNLTAELSLDGLSGKSEEKAIELAKKYEIKRGMEVISVEKVSEYGVGYDLLSQTPNGVTPFEERHIEVKGRKGNKSTILLTSHQIAEAESEPEYYYLYIFIFLDHKALLYIIENPADKLRDILEENGN